MLLSKTIKKQLVGATTNSVSEPSTLIQEQNNSRMYIYRHYFLSSHVATARNPLSIFSPRR